MFAKFAPVATVLALALGAAADLTLSTPASVPQCGKIPFTVGGATGTYSMFVVKPSDPCGDSLVDVHNLSGSSFEWVAALKEGTDVQFEIEDDAGNAGWSGSLKIVAGDDSCLSATASASGTAVRSAVSASSTHTTASLRPGNGDTPANAAGGDANAAFSTRSLSGFAGFAIAAAAAVLAL